MMMNDNDVIVNVIIYGYIWPIIQYGFTTMIVGNDCGAASSYLPCERTHPGTAQYTEGHTLCWSTCLQLQVLILISGIGYGSPPNLPGIHW